MGLFRPQFSLPFIDADSVSSLVGNDDLTRYERQSDSDSDNYRLRSVKSPPSRKVSREEPQVEETIVPQTEPRRQLEEVKVSVSVPLTLSLPD